MSMKDHAAVGKGKKFTFVKYATDVLLMAMRI